MFEDDNQAPSDPIADDLLDADDAAASAAVATAVDEGDDDDAAVDAALHAAIAGKGADAARAAFDAKAPKAAVSPKSASTGEAGKAKQAGTTPVAADAQPPAVDDETRQLLQRYKVRESVLQKLDPEEVVEFVANLKERHDAQAQLYAANQQMQAALKARPQQQQAPAAQQQGQAQGQQQADPTDAFTRLDAIFAPFMDEGTQIAAPLKEAVQATLAPIIARAEAAEKQVAAFWQHQEQVDIAEGIKAIKVADVPMDERTAEGKANKQKLLSTAERLLAAAQQQPGWTPYKYGWKEAISEAFPSTFKAQNKLAQRRDAAKAAAQAARRGSDTGGSPSGTKPAESDDALYDRLLDAQKNGATRDELTAMAAGKG